MSPSSHWFGEAEEVSMFKPFVFPMQLFYELCKALFIINIKKTIDLEFTPNGRVILKGVIQMNKKIVILSSSPRKEGNSELLCDEFSRGAQESGHEVVKINIRDKKINFCTACRVCRDNGSKCIQNDDMEGIIDKVIEADVFVMATPIYFYSISAQLKTVIDRFYAREAQVFDKKAYFIGTSGAKSKDALDVAIGSFRGLLRILKNVEEGGIIYGTGAYWVGDIKTNPAMVEAYEMGRNI